ncbi:MAG: cyclic nucleotide-binding domain-containing protein [Acidimicrobiia bacterium]|nr:cyclic nucleotide-binding domain-containing protein [Acidimicrobiia bacterium]
MADVRVEKLLTSIELFSALDDVALAKLSAGAESLHLRGGEVLLREGDPSDALYVVASGRMQAFVTTDGTEALVGEIGRGEVIGEMGILADEARSATVRALRDSNLLRFPRDMFVGFLHDHPEELFAITQLIIQRLRRSIRSGPAAASVRTVAIIPLGREGETFARHLTSMFSERLDARLIGGDDVDESLGDGEMTRYLHELEASTELLVYLADRGVSAWTERCIRQADRIVLVAEAESDSALTEVEHRLLGPDRAGGRARIDLVLIHPDHTAQPSRARQWLNLRTVYRHHHVRLHSRDDLHRVVRALTGREIGLVLSGGGARGIIHIGILKALNELNIPVDVVGGSSAGALGAGSIATGGNWEHMRDSLWDNLASKGSPVDLTAPAISLAKGERITEAITGAFGDTLIENLWLRFFCVSSNLSQGEVMVHHSGLLWKALRASVSIPGLWPPVRTPDGDVLVDGAVMNNLPVDVMQSFHDGGAIIAVNLKGTAALGAVDLTESGVMSGWAPLARRVNPFAESARLPGIVDILLRSTETGNVLASKRLEREADIVLHPDVASFGLLDFEGFDRLIEVGYAAAMDEFPHHEALLSHLL